MHGSGPNRLFRVAVATVATVARTTQRVASQQAPTIRTHNQPVVPVSMTIELADVENQKRGSEAQGLPLSTQLSSLEWRNVQFQVPVKRTPIDKIKGLPASNKVILSSVNGVAHAGKLTAIMGPSGGGKTSLLNVLAGTVQQTNGATLTGEVLVDGRARSENWFKAKSAYVTQEDLLFAQLTVWETFWISCRLRMPSKPTDWVNQHVEALIRQLGLGKCMNTLVGDATIRGVSGGERRRVAIGVQLLSNPSLIFLDEPTSGLDSFQAESVVTTLKALANQGRLVMCSIHQPKSSVFQRFDDLVLLAEGSMVYQGKVSEVTTYFSRHGYECPSQYNPADFLLDTASIDTREKTAEQESRDRVNILVKAWREAEQAQESAIVPAGERESEWQLDNPKPLSIGEQVVIFFDQFWLLLLRSLKQTFRNIPIVRMKIMMGVFFGLLLSTIYYNLGTDQQSIQNRTGLLYFVAINQNLGPLLSAANTFPDERKVVNRERGYYSLFAYYCTKVFSELFFTILPAVLFTLVLYAFVPLRFEDDGMGWFMLLCILEAIGAATIGLAVSACAQSTSHAIMMIPPVFSSMILMGGFFIAQDSLPDWCAWIPEIVVLRWTYEGLMDNEYSGRTLSCGDSPACVPTGEGVLQQYGIEDADRATSAANLVYIALGLQALAFGLLWLNKTRYMSIKHKP